ncbi:phage tail protein [Paenibacillus alvei]|uniref:Phage tail protein n=1 Tax=Paenibacillus alvei TaxID=44250 RepID=A0ABT4H7G3_PAEAL|nr:phage tail protein [Paenibacillus alvei]MCY9764925.1 phage tail protein [Paenibacillus alvei]MCY9771333.1 phage tail protein [Paenibacillus alvei]
MIGAFGDVNFLVTNTKIRTYDDFVRHCQGRWAEHAIIGKKPLSQFIGPGLDTISFSMSFALAHGTDPRYETDRLIKMERSGKPFTLTIGNKKYGTYKWALTSLEVEDSKVDNKGKLLAAAVRVEMREYAK